MHTVKAQVNLLKVCKIHEKTGKQIAGRKLDEVSSRNHALPTSDYRLGGKKLNSIEKQQMQLLRSRQNI